MKAAFAAGRYQEVLEAFERLAPLEFGCEDELRVEAIALAARTHLAVGAKKPARELLKLVWQAPLKNHRLCRRVAIASLELGDTISALSLIEKAVQLSDANKSLA